MSQQALAVAVGMSTAAVTQWERDRIAPKRSTAEKLDATLDAGGEIMSAFGYSAEVDTRDEISQLRSEVAALSARLQEQATLIGDLLGDVAMLRAARGAGGSAP